MYSAAGEHSDPGTRGLQSLRNESGACQKFGDQSAPCADRKPCADMSSTSLGDLRRSSPNGLRSHNLLGSALALERFLHFPPLFALELLGIKELSK
jgi:hypothetical protein